MGPDSALISQFLAVVPQSLSVESIASLPVPLLTTGLGFLELAELVSDSCVYFTLVCFKVNPADFKEAPFFGLAAIPVT
ncbi:hypothetical protein BJP37_27395 [Moorena bouillonii PNG]|uniref:Uncharacterized protein n=1 Tax=Moorena bouillonii PNG TaxID=568701 RepID=A0A1U7N8A5_9CYAN|nr:hypothetical protein BJP37_27395 [Moorena bouillonii PNG]